MEVIIEDRPVKNMLKTYRIKFNDFGIRYVVAENFSEAEEYFLAVWKEEHGNFDSLELKEIAHTDENRSPIIPTT